MADAYWFTPEQLAEMARPTMDSALEALEAKNYEKVAELCESMKHEWRFLHDLMAESLLALLTYIGEVIVNGHPLIPNRPANVRRSPIPVTGGGAAPSRKAAPSPA